MGSECFRCAELLFRPSLMGLDMPGLAHGGLHCHPGLRHGPEEGVLWQCGALRWVPQAAHVGAGVRLAIKAGNPVLIVAGAQWGRGGWVVRGAEMGPAPACSRLGMWVQEAAALQMWIAVLGFGLCWVGRSSSWQRMMQKGACQAVRARSLRP